MKRFLKDLLSQLWTLLGMFVAWIVLEGSAKAVVGWMIIGVIAIWVLSFPLRNKE
jgi:hypothetical protein